MSRTPRPGLFLVSALPMLVAVALVGCKGKPADSGPTSSGPDAASAAPASAASTPPAPTRSVRQSPRDAVDEVMARFLAATSYHVAMDTRAGERAMTLEMDFVAPDRYRMSLPSGTQYVIGDTMYMSAQGRTMKVPMSPGQTSQFRDSARFAEHRATMTVDAQGSEPIDGKAAQKFVIRNTQPEPSESTMWVGDDGYPVQVSVTGQAGGQTTQTMIRYSRFNDPTIKIDPPQ
ncbi:LolA family protein [Agrilutibacter solisilvae]|uniref:Uncharacterized protein n=1 Tax=Agrilutibacter solisilvae TaxID=2763317 RepID=A0A975ASZ4_9GAMM|nr:hypothetical protein [Lysobacter solisilvae]QSX78773.1 hypothetical protein I8J32_002235 [Lysobacter solisilvae]